MNVVPDKKMDIRCLFSFNLCGQNIYRLLIGGDISVHMNQHTLMFWSGIADKYSDTV